ncbi:MAG: hypothetical protein ED559_11155 [Phycisphaera sp.]|nr:MAG: hypothetical protein ED559_11155 [Phycisphaera sp.]
MNRLLAIAAYVGIGFGAGSSTAQVCGWEAVTQTGTPGGPRLNPRVVYDSTASVVILFGGGTTGGYPAGTWAWNGTAWSQIPTTTDPIARNGHAMALRPGDATQTILLYGGERFGSFLSDTWSFDGNDWTHHASAVGPPGHRLADMVFHEALGVFVHFGGGAGPSGNTAFADTYHWDGQFWNAVFAPGPSERMSHMMAYDPIRQEAVLFGGLRPGFGNQSDTWTYDASGWTLKSTSGPPPLRNAAMDFDHSRGTVVLHGGRLNSFAPNNQTWEWNGSTWTLVGELNPIAREFDDMVYDHARGQLLLLGGTVPGLFAMNWSDGPSITPVGGSETADYPCPLTLGISATGSGTLSYQWYKDNVALTDGGAITGAQTPTLTINPTDALTGGGYRCEITDTCTTKSSGTILVNTRCLADVNGNGVADPGDYTAWINAFNNNDSAAEQNCDGTVTPTDFTAWIANFNAGC